MKQLSIITICYNEPNLEKTCESIVNQTWQNFEWIVTDGGSNEETQKIWNKYKYRIDKFISEPDNGIYNACNKGIKLSNGQYLIFMNAGDSFYDNTVLENIFKKKYKSDILYGDAYYINGIKPSQSYVFKTPETMNIEFLIKSCLCHQASFIRSELFNKYGLYDESFKIVADYEKWFVFLKEGAVFEHLPLIIANYKLDGVSSFNSKMQKTHDKERKYVLNKYCSKKQIEEILNQKTRYSFFENIFSLKNTHDKTHKVITMFGIHCKIRRKNK